MRILLCVHATMPNKKNKKVNKIFMPKEHIIKGQCWMKKIMISPKIMIQITLGISWNKAICQTKLIIQVKQLIMSLIQNLELLPHLTNIPITQINFKITLIINRVLLDLRLMHILSMKTKHISGILKICHRRCKTIIIIIHHSILKKACLTKIHCKVFPLKINKLRLQGFKSIILIFIQMTRVYQKLIIWIAINSHSINRILYIDKKAKIHHDPDLEKTGD